MSTDVIARPVARGQSSLRRAVSGAVNDSLLRNSSFLMVNSLLVAGLGFLFWTLASRFFPASAVGTTATVISAVAFAATVGTLGLPNTVIRFLAREADPVPMLVTIGAVAAGAGALVGLVWCAVPRHFGVPLSAVAPGWTTTPIIVALVALGSVGAVAQAAIIALRKSKWVVVENGAGSLVKLLALPLAFGFGAAGLFGLFFASVAVSTIASIAIIVREVGGSRDRWLRGVDVRSVTHTRSFAAGNHVAVLVAMLPATVLPIIVLHRLGADAAAYFAMPLMIVGLVNVIPSMASQSLFAEAAADEASLDRQARRALRGIYSLLVPAIIVLIVFARPVLSLFGPDYAEEGTRCLQFLALSGVFAGFSYVADTVINARKRVAGFVFVNVVGTVCVIGFPIALLGHGLTGVGFGWLLGQIGYFVVAAATLAWDRPVVSRPRPGRKESTWS